MVKKQEWQKCMCQHIFRTQISLLSSNERYIFNTLITTYTYNYTAYIDYFIIILIFTTHYITRFSFLQATSIELMTRQAVSFTEMFHESLKKQCN